MATFLITGVTLGDSSVASDGLTVRNTANNPQPVSWASLRFGVPITHRGESGAGLTLDLADAYTPPNGHALSLALSGPPLLLASLAATGVLGRPGIANAAQAAYPTGWESFIVGAQARVTDGREATALVLDLIGAYSVPTALNVGMYLDGHPLAAHVSVGEGMAFGTHKITAPLQAKPKGFGGEQVPVPLVHRGQSGYRVLLDLIGTYAPPAGSALSLPLSGDPLLLAGLAMQGAVGVPGLANAAQAAYPSGLDATIFGAQSRLNDGRPSTLLHLDLIGNYAPPSAAAIQMVWASEDKAVSPPGVDALGMGTASLINVSQGLFPAGVDAASVPLPALHDRRYLKPAGLAPSAYGFGQIENMVRYVGAVGYVASAFGTAHPWLFDSILKPTGIKQDGYGNATFAGGVREAPANGFTTAAYGKPTVTLASREVFPSWFVDTRYGTPAMGWDRTITATGADTSRYGTALVWDNTQHVAVPGLDANAFGTAWADRYTRSLLVKAFPDGDLQNIGFPRLVNRNQFVTANYIADQWIEGGIGDYQSMFVRNVNRKVDLVGNGIAPLFRQIPLTHEVLNGARVLLPHGLDATLWGVRAPVGGTFIAPRVRSFPMQGFQPVELSSRFHLVRNAAAALAPVGFNAGAVGVPPLVVNTRRYFSGIRVGQTDGYGLPFIAPRVRSIGPQNPLEPVRGIIGGATVWFRVRPLTPLPPDFGWGAFGRHTLETRINAVAAKSVPPSWQWGYPGVRNLTPEITPYWDSSLFTRFGATATFNRWNWYAIEGWHAELWGPNTIITYRTKRPIPAGFDAARYNPKHTIRNVNPDPPGQHYVIGATLGALGGMGEPDLNNNGLFAVGIFDPTFGSPTLQGMSLFPHGIPPIVGDNGTQFGTPLLPGRQRATVEGILEEGYGKPRLSPYTIWAPDGAPLQAERNHGSSGEMIDAYLDRDNLVRPLFGRPRVELKNRIVRHQNTGVHTGYGQPRISRKPIYVTPDGPRFTKYGFPVLFGGDHALLHAGFDLTLWGEPKLTIPEPFNRTVKASGSAMGAFGATWVANFIRYPGVAGLNATRFGTTWVQRPPPPAYPKGLDATQWGEKLPTHGMFVAYRIRHLPVEGLDTFVCDYTLGNFRDRMRLSGRNRLAASVGATGTMGTPSFEAKDRTLILRAILPVPGAVPVPATRKQNRVQLVSAGALSAFGEPWALPVTPGTVQPRGQDMAQYGHPQGNYQVFPDGSFSFAAGAPSLAQPIDVSAIEPSQWGELVVMGFGCGRQARAVRGWASATFGAVGVSRG